MLLNETKKNEKVLKHSFFVGSVLFSNLYELENKKTLLFLDILLINNDNKLDFKVHH